MLTAHLGELVRVHCKKLNWDEDKEERYATASLSRFCFNEVLVTSRCLSCVSLFFVLVPFVLFFTTFNASGTLTQVGRNKKSSKLSCIIRHRNVGCFTTQKATFSLPSASTHPACTRGMSGVLPMWPHTQQAKTAHTSWHMRVFYVQGMQFRGHVTSTGWQTRFLQSQLCFVQTDHTRHINWRAHNY